MVCSLEWFNIFNIKNWKQNISFRILVDHTFDFNDNITFINVDHNSFTSYTLSSFRGMNFKAIKIGK